MSITTNMGLTSWDLPGDTFSRIQLHNNWQAIDAHDHSPTKGVLIPTAGIANGAITSAKIAASAITATNVATSSIPDAALVSPMNGAYKPVAYASGLWDGTGGTFLLTNTGSMISTAATSHAGAVVVPFTPADHPVPGMTCYARVRYQWARNAVAASGAHTINLSINTTTASAGTAGLLTYTLGSAVVGSTYTISSPVASTFGQSITADFILSDPTYSNYVFVMTSAGAAPAASYGIGITAMIQIHHTL